MKLLLERPDSRWQRGVTLVEVLIAVLVLSVGLLGVAGLQGTSLRNSYSSYQRSQAVSLGYEVIDAIRADRERVISSGIAAGYTDAWEEKAEGVLTDAGIDVDIDPQGSSLFIRVSIAWLDDRGELTDAVDCSALASAVAQSAALGSDESACTRLYLVSEL